MLLVIQALAIDKNGNVWIGTGDSGLVKFDGENSGQFIMNQILICRIMM